MRIEITYLDHAGTTLYARSLVEKVANDLKGNVLGNPHSRSPSSVLSTQRIDDARLKALNFFKADPEHFDLVFVQNATAAIKLVADGLVDFARRRQQTLWYGYHAASHTSLVGVRELATSGSRCFENDKLVDEWISARKASSADPNQFPNESLALFAYPAQSNMDGRRLPLSWPGKMRDSRQDRKQDTYVLLDASALCTTAQLDLSDHTGAPDFVALSFYKIFGYPDLGGLIIRKSSGHALTQRRYYGGGTVDMVTIENKEEQSWHATKQDSLHEALEDGTPPFHNIIALSHAIDTHQKLFKSMYHISSHTSHLAKVLFDGMNGLRYHNGVKLCKVYQDPRSTYGDARTQGPTIAFNVRRSDKTFIGKSFVEQLAISEGIHLRTGGVCNPGGIAAALDLSPEELRDNYEEGLRCGNGIDELNGKPTGIIRISLGAMSSEKEVRKILRFLGRFVQCEAPPSISDEKIFTVE